MPNQDCLLKDVIEAGYCSSCGMCVGLCPYIKSHHERICMIHRCGLPEGSCYRVCSRAGIDLGELDRAVYGREREDQALGIWTDIYISRSRQKVPRAQYGGTTSALAALALTEGLVPALALAGGDPHHPRPALAQTPAEVFQAAGSRYTGIPTMEVLNRALSSGLSGLGMIGRPCQVTAARLSAVRELPGPHFGPRSITLLLGLFCFFAFTPAFYDFIAEEIPGEQLLKVDIPPAGVTATTASGRHCWPLERFRPLIRPACLSCFDSTAEWSDIAIGSTEFDPAWNTLVIRTETGKELVELALQRNILELKAYPPARLPLLRQAALDKKMRVLADTGGLQGRITMPPSYRRNLEKQWGGKNH